MKLSFAALITAFVVLPSVAHSAVIFTTNSSPPIFGAIPDPFPSAQITLDGQNALLIVGTLNSLPTEILIVEILGDGTNQEIFTITSSPLVDAFLPQSGFPGGVSATYHESFVLSDSNFEALQSGSIALFSVLADGTSQTQRFTLQTIPEPSVPFFAFAGVLVGFLRRTR